MKKKVFYKENTAQKTREKNKKKDTTQPFTED